MTAIRSRVTLCPHCGEKKLSRRVCGLCEECYPKRRLCPVCNQVGRIRHTLPTRCDRCNRRARAQKNFAEIATGFRPATEYNGVLFKMYIQYILALVSANLHFLQARQFKAWLESRPIPLLNSWSVIREQSAQFRAAHPGPGYAGRPFFRLGYMLSSVGTLPQNFEEKSAQIEKQMKRFSGKAAAAISRYTGILKKRHCTHRTIILHLWVLRDLEEWLSLHHSGSDLFSVNQVLAERYLASKARGLGPRSMESDQYALRRFYEWCRSEKLILANPWPKPPRRALRRAVCVCTEREFKKLGAYIRSERSDPEGALVLFLILFFGLTKNDLRFATVRIDAEGLVILLRRPPPTQGRRAYNRASELKLPASPPWCEQLQKRFIAYWRRRFDESTNPMRLPLLILAKHQCATRACNPEKIRELVLRVSSEAVGRAITSQVLRQTCAHLYAQRSDASILTALGWSRLTAFSYTWRPRIFDQPGSSR